MKIQITSNQELEEQDREYTRNLSHDERMEYLQKLIGITHSEQDLKDLTVKFKNSKIIINQPK